jgi:mannose-6-phosphate isomerase-like protein (cupin superfamily)
MSAGTAHAVAHPRGSVSARDRAGASQGVGRPPVYYELAGQNLEEAEFTVEHSWCLRAQNFCVAYTWASMSTALKQADLLDEHILVVPGTTPVQVDTLDGQQASVVGPAVIIVPPGTSSVTTGAAGALVQVFSSRAAAVLVKARNGNRYSGAEPEAAALPVHPSPSPGTLRTYCAADIPEDPSRPGRIFRTDSLMINWFASPQSPRDIESLSPHVHKDFEHVAVTLAGEHIHHLRTPWTPQLRDWRDDEHVEVTSPSVTIIPPGILHTTQATGSGPHELIDVFAPPRADFAAKAWVINDGDYADGRQDGVRL